MQNEAQGGVRSMFEGRAEGGRFTQRLTPTPLPTGTLPSPLQTSSATPPTCPCTNTWTPLSSHPCPALPPRPPPLQTSSATPAPTCPCTSTWTQSSSHPPTMTLR